jgi:iron complex outermembrane receptor protein
MFLKVNISRGFRSPNIGELGSNGVHEGTLRYEIGDGNLKSETSFQSDLAFGINSEHVTCELSLFDNLIDHYIYTQKLNSVLGGDSIVDMSEPAAAFKFVQGNARLMGGEVLIDVHPHPYHWLHFENSFSLVNGILRGGTDSTKYLPFIPAPKYSSELKAEKDKVGKHLKNTYLMIGVDNFFRQNRVYSAFGTETETPGYTLLNFGAGADLINKKGNVICSAFISVNNITDVAYQSHLSRLKYGPVNHASGRAGVYNMGRNISFKLVIPFDIKKAKD